MTTALYRRYRPETFAEVIGQEHVTAPLMQALRSGRVNHAYLFSGPRGCGKTTSARILARTLNCARNTPESPLAVPCGECASCVELARGGPGSLDVVEIDAASHNGVDDARDLRERATFAPARDRYKIFILDEAHMVTPQGFNALLKIVEEPPPHIKFVFATTEPDKVIGTIRSRTHHYPFRLVPPDVLGPYLEQLCEAEGIRLGGGVVPLVTRAGGGSVRDSLSVLDQLIAGATEGTVEYDTAVGLLGFTHATLLDDVVDALAARDGASIFRVVDQIVATGHEPRRFVEDLLERLRDLIVIAVSGDAADAVLRGLPPDQLERMRAQASRLGMAELSRAADLVNTALTEMTGATSPRLHLELLCARLLLPGADDGTVGLAARIDRLERGAIAAGGAPVASASVDDRSSAPEPAAGTVSEPATTGAAVGVSGAAAVRAALQASRRPAAEPEPAAAPEPAVEPSPAAPGPAEADRTDEVPPVDQEPPELEPFDEAPSGEPERVPEPEPVEVEPVDQAEPEPVDEAPSTAPDPAPSAPESAVTSEVVRRRWREVLTAIPSPRAATFLGENARVLTLEGDVLRLGFAPAVVALARQGRPETISDAVYQALGIAVRIEIVELDAGPSPREADDAPARPDPGDDAPEEPDRPEWPDVPPPGEAQPRSGVTGRDPRGGAQGAATVSAAEVPRGGVAVAERVAPARSAADEADAAWLAGSPPAAVRTVPPEAAAAPEPARPDAAAALAAPDTAPPSSPVASSPAAWSPDESSAPVAEPTPEPAPDPGPPAAAPSGAQAARLAAEQALAASRARTQEPAARPAAAPASPAADYDEASDDDPDITASGLVGVPLVMKVLGGTIIDEQAEQP
ncbi:DNA polymerase III subunit gamma and tau [Isoptericola sp. BMS4]|uniref:DNA polymerase III subunit gamma and tau n=1 Tax=Isoptericola sp. BMS4 TaxID=2527875 RepID=UPI00142326A1|nr:DNA polymerase III subunit gamma and tau [Isoptericola sp. BMS4]